MRKIFASLLAVSALAGVSLTGHHADACGGCFVPVTENTVVTGHRMALAISKSHAVLWDQIQYSGDPEEFSWVLPVKKGAFVEVANDAFFDVLESGTATTVSQPPEGCVRGSSGGGIGCGSSDALSASAEGGGRGSGVEVIHEGTVGPYDTVTLSAENPNALAEWLQNSQNGTTSSSQTVGYARICEEPNAEPQRGAGHERVYQIRGIGRTRGDDRGSDF